MLFTNSTFLGGKKLIIKSISQKLMNLKWNWWWKKAKKLFKKWTRKICENLFIHEIHWLFGWFDESINEMLHFFRDWDWRWKKNTTKLFRRNCHFLCFHSSISGICFPQFSLIGFDVNFIWLRCAFIYYIKNDKICAYCVLKWPSFKNLKHFGNRYWNLILTSWM